jgi:hypothetical protein
MKHAYKILLIAAGSLINASASWADTLSTHRIPTAQCAERQRIANHYARLTREQEERQNAEAGQRFTARNSWKLNRCRCTNLTKKRG